MKTINLAVRELVEFVMMSGDLVLDKFSARGNLITGQKIHQRLQAQRPENYQTEVAISDIFTRDNLQIRLNGRIDGIFQQPAGIILEEIKSITSENHRKGNLDHPRHWAQAKVYAYLYMKAKDLNIIRIRLTYYFVESGTTESQEKEFGFRELEEFTTDLIDQYSTWLLRYEDYHLHRDRSLQQSRFPYQDYRQGQEQICTAVAKAIRESRDVFLQAPTGLGKTMAVIYPAVLSLTELESGKIFYLTARSTAQENAEYALKKIIAAGAGIKFLVISAREKVCFQEECRCNPDDCEYAAGFFDKLPAALWELYKHNIFDRKRIDEISIRHKICPFEYSLEISLWVDCIICDYNYVFDPRVRLKRFFMNERQKGDFILLVDEAHNLVDRSRDMFSASLNKKDFLKIRRLVRG
ncbi:MAG: DEAD/DEAH box helicase, partial [Candidatus Cloacimonetes bacterium]|nr:DEAD/DEAH box helicase [Candidatus Cloacimonadota bacterium]